MAGCYGNSFEDRHFEGMLMRHLDESDEDTCYLNIREQILEVSMKNATSKLEKLTKEEKLGKLLNKFISVVDDGCLDCKENNPEVYKECQQPLI